jgi:hypothetical protein
VRYLLIACVVALVATACQGNSTSGSPSPSAGPDGVAGLVARIRAAGAVVTEAEAFSTDPLSGRGVLLCLGDEPVRVYEFASAAERGAVASRIDPDDPSNVGTAIVEWAGRPRFWQGDRILVLYLGESAATEALLASVLGPPFAEGPGRAPLQARDCA